MRTRTEIESSLRDSSTSDGVNLMHNITNQRYILEVLLDIRDLLIREQKPDITMSLGQYNGHNLSCSLYNGSVNCDCK